MNIHLIRNIDRGQKEGIGQWILPLLTHRFGVTSAMLLLCLIVSESYLRTKSYGDGSVYVGGPGSLVGLFMVVRATISARSLWKNYLKTVNRSSDHRPFVKLTEDFLENGVEGLWKQRFSWKMLVECREDKRRFVLKTVNAQVLIEKNEIENASDIVAIREFVGRVLAEK